MSIGVTIIVILWINYICDFLFQGKKEAENKSKSLYWLFVHVGLYTLYFSVLLTIYNLFTHTFAWNWLYLLCLINGITHFIADYFTSKCTTYFYKKGQFRSFLKMIGFDGLIHITILVILTILYANN